MIGRAAESDIVLVDQLVSRHHARLESSPDSLTIRDLGSVNGTRVNGVEIEPRTPVSLRDSDTIIIGGFVLKVHFGGGRPTVPVSSSQTIFASVAVQSKAAFVAPYLVVRSGDSFKEYALKAEIITLGRDSVNDIVIEHPLVSRKHARLERKGQNYQITDLGSVNGLTVAGHRVATKLLASGDVVLIGGSISIEYRIKDVSAAGLTAPLQTPEVRASAPIFSASAVTAGPPLVEATRPALQRSHQLMGTVVLGIGRNANNAIVLDNVSVSRFHARIWQQPGGAYFIEDMGSANGTFVNGQRLTRALSLKHGDNIRIGPVKFLLENDILQQVDEGANLGLDAIHLNQCVNNKLNLLKDISLSIRPHEFVAVVGVSGAGKSTLLMALNGFKPASSGAIMVNGSNLYQSFDAHRTQLGYVPQEDIIHRELTVSEGLGYAARLRLPADSTQETRKQRVREVIDVLGLAERKDLPVGKLSGGQRKRVSIGVELLTQPGLFFLDEATSGLDPGTEKDLMRLLRKLSDEGHTILLVTHATKNVMLCDQVIFLAKGGYLAYYGPPDEALQFFGVNEFDEIYSKLEKELTPEAWGQLYRQSLQYQKYVVARLEEKNSKEWGTAEGLKPNRPSPGASRNRVSSLGQLVTLSARNINVLFRDKISLALMFLVAPVVASFDFLVWKKGFFLPSGGEPQRVMSSFFLALIMCALVGALSSMREIVRENDIYRRERMVSLRILPYSLSKVWFVILLSLYQAGILLLGKKLAADWPPTGEGMAQAYVTIWLAILGGMVLGLLISAISPNQNVAPLLLIVFLIPNILFGGILPLGGGSVTKALGNLATTRWAFESMVTISKIGHNVALDPCRTLPEEERGKLTEKEKAERCTSLGPKIFKTGFPGILDYYSPMVDTDEPLAPEKPAEPPGVPQRPSRPAPDATSDVQLKYQQQMQAYEKNMEQYQKEVDKYQAAMKKYQDDVDAWRDTYLKWKEARSKAIGSAEAVIQRYYHEYGHMFNVDLGKHWLYLGALIIGMFGVVLVAQKLKDVF